MATARNLLAKCRDRLVSRAYAVRAPRMQWTVGRIDGRFRIMKNGVPFDLKGVTGWDYVHLDEIPRIGGTAFRGLASLRGLNEAWRLGLHVLVNLPSQGEADGLDWDDPEQVERQSQRIIRIVRRLKHHPAVMMWSVGNELDHIPRKPGEDLPYHPRLWEHVNDLAKAVKRADPARLVCACTGTGTIDLLERKLPKLARGCRDVDLFGLNNFLETGKAISLVNRYWNRPFFFSEWAANTAWVGPQTAWGAMIEPTSSEKAALISHRYRNLIQPATQCVGGFLYFWGERGERTHTWFGLFRDGMRTQSLDVIQKHWTGSWPDKRAPSVFKVLIVGQEKETDVSVQPDETCEAHVYCPESDSVGTTITWHLHVEVHRPPDDYAGTTEKHDGPIPFEIVFQDAKVVRFITPSKRGPYRLFVQVADNCGNVGYGNVPFFVGES